MALPHPLRSNPSLVFRTEPTPAYSVPHQSPFAILPLSTPYQQKLQALPHPLRSNPAAIFCTEPTPRPRHQLVTRRRPTQYPLEEQAPSSPLVYSSTLLLKRKSLPFPPSPCDRPVTEALPALPVAIVGQHVSSLIPTGHNGELSNDPFARGIPEWRPLPGTEQIFGTVRPRRKMQAVYPESSKDIPAWMPRSEMGTQVVLTASAASPEEQPLALCEANHAITDFITSQIERAPLELMRFEPASPIYDIATIDQPAKVRTVRTNLQRKHVRCRKIMKRISRCLTMILCCGASSSPSKSRISRPARTLSVRRSVIRSPIDEVGPKDWTTCSLQRSSSVRSKGNRMSSVRKRISLEQEAAVSLKILKTGRGSLHATQRQAGPGQYLPMISKTLANFQSPRSSDEVSAEGYMGPALASSPKRQVLSPTVGDRRCRAHSGYRGVSVDDFVNELIVRGGTQEVWGRSERASDNAAVARREVRRSRGQSWSRRYSVAEAWVDF